MTIPTKTPRPGDQPLPKRGIGPSMHDLAIDDLRQHRLSAVAERALADLAERKRIGLERYGQPLQAYNGRDASLDLYQELQDAVVYARQWLEEQVAGDLDLWREVTDDLYRPLLAMLLRVRRLRDEAK